MSLLSLLNVTVSVGEPTNIPDDTGAFSVSYKLTTYPAAVQVDRSAAGQEFLRETGRRLFSVYLPTTATVQPEYQITVSSGEYSDVVAQARSVVADHAGRSTYWHVLAEEGV